MCSCWPSPQILRDLMEDRDAALRKGRAIAKALAARDAARDATLDAMLRVLDGRKARWLLRRVLAGWHSHVEKATMLRNMRALSATSLSPAASSEAREAAAAPLVDALFSHRPSTLLDTSQLRDSLLGPIRASSSTSVGSAPNQTNGPAAVPPEIAPPSPRASTAFTSDPATPSSPVTPADASGGWRQREEGLLKRLQHLSVENAFLRERVDHLETSVRSLTGELVDKKELLHHVSLGKWPEPRRSRLPLLLLTPPPAAGVRVAPPIAGLGRRASGRWADRVGAAGAWALPGAGRAQERARGGRCDGGGAGRDASGEYAVAAVGGCAAEASRAARAHAAHGRGQLPA